MNRLHIALCNVRKYNNYQTAQDAAISQKYHVPVILGDDNMFWVSGTNRESGVLISSGYEKA